MVEAIRPRYDTVLNFDQRGISLTGLSCDGEPNLASAKRGEVWAAVAGQLLVKSPENESWGLGAVPLAERFAVAGEDAVHAVEGAYSSVLYDSAAGTCLAFTDFVGQIPLFYLIQEDCVYFASQLAPFLLQDSLPLMISGRGLGLFLSFGCVPGAETIISGVRKLLPGTMATISRDGVSKRRYWRIGEPRTDYSKTTATFVNEIASCLESSVSTRVAVARRGLGILLGGLDSSIVAALMRRSTPERILAMTATFEDPRFNERAVDSVSNMFGLELHEVPIRADDIPQAFNDIAEAFDEPVSDMIVSPIAFALALKTPHEVKTLFDGTGADDLFQGIPHASSGRKLDAVLNRFPITIRSIIRVGARGALHLQEESYNDSLLSPLLSTPVEREIESWRTMPEAEVESMLSAEAGSTKHAASIMSREIERETVGMVRDPENIWAKTAVSMYFGPTHGFDCSRNRAISYEYGVALASPFYDRSLYNLGLSVPWYFKTPKGGLSKPLLRLVAVKRGILPPEVATLRKMGLGSSRQSLTDAQMKVWASSELSGWIGEAIHEGMGAIDHLIPRDAVERYLRSKRPDEAFQLIQLALWYKAYFGDRKVELSRA
jgi:asparagine synthase (glutamine-hydrolysing)